MPHARSSVSLGGGLREDEKAQCERLAVVGGAGLDHLVQLRAHSGRLPWPRMAGAGSQVARERHRVVVASASICDSTSGAR
jgi:hypothetical protein